ncbi:HEAT repeat domain-containing protein [Tuwongella immobilis]|uniref:HEAT repeat domain-containing protein n=1 Tax=Tuwongella immobilis TaxID=692036 RepID=A0A6C2YV84_9BACT|nr:HEAT repeat domain-containing protein [Tuwongella immobilis]VIP04782.1 heat-repeat-containing pbs lyase : HEAT-repeat-containing PBS lyase OS=Anabaena sp. 90 GN=ANA_C10863 PE=4 SV=1: HEAT_2 [Tuwongella immobilis]VTS06923.1 heat-repeat-containing pbs lyase : HEAT-repeat-containing PBS lyase OS=Anabaena sp. 90 GN=ANA_C10863 PE=4 SV=1: HEAT_2 [Tuwongella immobilis]
MMIPNGIDAILDGLIHSHASIRDWAQSELSLRHELPIEVLPRLVAALDAPDPFVHVEALKALARWGAAATPAIPQVVRILCQPPNSLIQLPETTLDIGPSEAIRTLAAIGEAAVGPLQVLVRGRDRSKRLAAVWALSALAAVSPAAMPVLAVALQDSDAWVRAQAASGLGACGVAAKEFLPNLREAAAMSDGCLRAEVAYACQRIDPTFPADYAPILAELRRLLHSNSSDLRARAAYTVSHLAIRAKELVPDLIAALETDEDWADASLALTQIAQIHPEIIAYCIQLIAERTDSRSVHLSLALSRVTPPILALNPLLIEQYRTGGLNRTLILSALSRIPGEPEVMIPFLASVILDGSSPQAADDFVRSTAIRQLAAYVDRDPERVTAVIVRASYDPNQQIHQAALSVLRKLWRNHARHLP